ncbi:MAG TPA: lysylphosphatidylglycerol synthase transmembrane domain-containing protein [Candidatus Brocadiia bacterium]|nr:lysylphosphatidylglycerol synthase transmembrane domain-containing protein [Candidatus Brocadiia bacterium]
MTRAEGRRLVRVGFIVKIVCLALLLWLLSRFVGWRSVADALGKCDRGRIAVACFVFTPLVILGKAVRWHIMARSAVPGLNFARSFRSYMAGLCLACLTPAAAGELARGVYLSRDRKTELTTIALADKLIDLTALCAVAAVGGGYALGGAILIPLGLLIAAGGWSAWFVMPTLQSRIADRLPAGRLWDFVRRAAGAVAGISPRLAAQCALLATANFLIYFVQTWVVMRAFMPEFDFRAIAVFPLVTLSTLLPLTPIGGIGVRESAAALLLSRFNVPPEVAVNAAFIQYAIVTLVPALLGAVFVINFPSGDGKTR